MGPFVLVIGYRKPLCQALQRLGLSYCLWTEQKPNSALEWKSLHLNDIPNDPADLPAALAALPLPRHPTHVIAGVESAVFPAAAARRFFKARRSPETILIRCTDKVAMKVFLRKNGIAMTNFSTSAEGLTASQLVTKHGLPLVIKNRRGSGGREMIFAKDLAEVSARLSGERVFETFIDAPEGSIESFVVNREIVFANITDYFRKGAINVLPANYSAREVRGLLELNQSVIRTLSIKWGMTHLEFYRTPKGAIFGEIALRPPGGHIMDLIQSAYWFDPWQAYVQVELDLPVAIPKISNPAYQAVAMLHPGAGRIAALDPPTAADYPTLKQVKLKAALGDMISARQAVSENVGYCFFESKNDAILRADLERFSASQPVVIESV